MPRPHRPLFFDSPIERHGRTLLLSYDAGLIYEGTTTAQHPVDPAMIMDLAESGLFTGVVLHKGVAAQYYRPREHRTPLVLQLNGRTNLANHLDPYAPQLCTVAEALGLGASAVRYAMYLGSQFESKMFEEFARIVYEAHQLSLMVIVGMQVCGHNVPDPTQRDVVAYAARVALELGADYAELSYPGSMESCRWVVGSGGKCRALMQLREDLPEAAVLETTRMALAAGVTGMTVGRAVWGSAQPSTLATALSTHIFTAHDER